MILLFYKWLLKREVKKLWRIEDKELDGCDSGLEIIEYISSRINNQRIKVKKLYDKCLSLEPKRENSET